MIRNICVHHFALASALAVLVCACKLPIDGLDAGFDDDTDDGHDSGGDGDGDDSGGDGDDALECLVGTQPTAVGVEQSVWETDCEVVCAEGWGHDGDQLPIAWTTSMADPFEDGVFLPHALGLKASGHLVVAAQSADTLDLWHFDPDGVGYGGYPAPNIRSHVFGVEIVEDRVYVTHGDDDGIVVASAVDLGSQQQLWAKEFAGAGATPMARGSGKVALVLTPDANQSDRELVMLDLDGELLWTTPTVGNARSLAFSPSGDRVAVAGTIVRLYATDDGALLDEIVHAQTGLTSGVVTFVGGDRLVTIGSSHTGEWGPEGWLAGDSLIDANDWEQQYNRALAWCPTNENNNSTSVWLQSVAALPDGTAVVTGGESYKLEDEGPLIFDTNPWVAHISADGELLASDRGLWTASALDSVAAPDGSVFVLSYKPSDLPGPPELRLRKYVP